MQEPNGNICNTDQAAILPFINPILCTFLQRITALCRSRSILLVTSCSERNLLVLKNPMHELLRKIHSIHLNGVVSAANASIFANLIVACVYILKLDSYEILHATKLYNSIGQFTISNAPEFWCACLVPHLLYILDTFCTLFDKEA